MIYDKELGKIKKIDFDSPVPAQDDEDEETLAAIDEGIGDAEAGRTVPMEDVRRLLPEWITGSFSPKGC